MKINNMCKQGITPELPWTRLAFPFPRLHCLSNKSPNDRLSAPQ